MALRNSCDPEQPCPEYRGQGSSIEFPKYLFWSPSSRMWQCRLCNKQCSWDHINSLHHTNKRKAVPDTSQQPFKVNPEFAKHYYEEWGWEVPPEVSQEIEKMKGEDAPAALGPPGLEAPSTSAASSTTPPPSHLVDSLLARIEALELRVTQLEQLPDLVLVPTD